MQVLFLATLTPTSSSVLMKKKLNYWHGRGRPRQQEQPYMQIRASVFSVRVYIF
jgi:hypothetical protein